MAQAKRKLEIVQKYYLRKEGGEIDYEHPYDLICETNKKGLYYVRLDGHIGYVDEKGEFVVPISYDFTRTTYKGETYCSNNHDWFDYDKDTIISYVYKDNGVGVINNRGEELVPCEFEKVEVFPWLASKNFIPVALPSCDNSKLVWGMYDVKNKRVSVTPQYEEIKKEQNGYASFKENGKWGILHCATGTVVVPAIYLLDMDVPNTEVVIAFLGGSWHYARDAKYTRYVNPDVCHILVLNGMEQAQVVVSGYDWIEESGPSVMMCRIGHEHQPKQEDSFKILKMPNYIGIVKNASYEAGYFLKESGEFVKKWTTKCTTYSKQIHAKYLSGGTFMAKTYDGNNIPVTKKMKQEILKRISEE